MMHPPIHNPMIPFIGPIFGGCQPGTLIDIQGHVPLHSNRFAVNIQCGPNVSPRDDVAFHINVDLLHNRIVRNSISQLNWGREEAHGYMPLTKGQPFSLVILCEPSKFNLAVNGVHFTEMSHRLPLHRVSHLAIDGDVTISSIQFSGGGAMPAHGQVGFNPTALSYTPGYNGHTPYPSGPGVPGQPYPMQQSTYPGQQPPYPVQPGMPGYGQPAFGGGGHNNHYPSGGGYPHPHHGGGGSMLGMGATGLGAGLVGATLAHKLSPVSEFHHRYR
uniref:Galectin n=1 Tax=Cacopsylla melanoneura TaxID=428564 RepID=A0A8D8S176_9HEMI